MAQSKYIESRSYLSRYGDERTLALRDSAARLASGFGSESEWLQNVERQFPKFIPFLVKECGLDFLGRVLEIGAGGAWLSAELSKLPRVVEVIAIDLSPRLLKERAPKVFKLLKANEAKITRIPGDYQRLEFPNNHFDFVVCSSALHYADSLVEVLSEVKRVLKPGGRFVAIREPVWPLVRIKSRSRMVERLVRTGYNERFYSLADYKEFFKQAGLPLEVKRVNISTGFKYFVNKMVNGLTHARYAFIGSKRTTPAPGGNGKNRG